MKNWRKEKFEKKSEVKKSKMYGLLLENLAEYVKSVYGEEKWEEIRQEAGISSPSFGTHTDFDESLLIFLAETAQEVSGFFGLFKFFSFLSGT